MISFCEKHGEYEEKEADVMGHKMPLGCPMCLEERRRRDEEYDEMMSRALAREKELHERALLIRRGIEPEFFGLTLGDYKAESESERRALDAAYALADGRIKKLILLGSFGTGKTMLASALAILFGGVRVTTFEISARIRAMYNSREGTEIDVLDGLLEYPFIAIDEIGRTKGSEAELNWLSYLIDKAHTRGIPLVLVSNRQRARSMPEESRGESFEAYLPNDALSRLKQDTEVIEIYGRDRRGSP